MNDPINVFELVRANRPIVQLFPDAAAGNDVFALLAATGALPVLSESLGEAAEITRASQALSLNLTAPTSHRNYAMKLSCQMAFQLHMPIVLNALLGHLSRMRIHSALSLLDIGVALLVCNPDLFFRLNSLCSESTHSTADLAETVRHFAIRWRTTIVTPGEEILIISPSTAALVRTAALSDIPSIVLWSMISGIFAAGLACKDFSQSAFDIALSVVAAFSACAEIVTERCPPDEDPMEFRHEFLRTLLRITPEQTRERCIIEML